MTHDIQQRSWCSPVDCSGLRSTRRPRNFAVPCIRDTSTTPDLPHWATQNSGHSARQLSALPQQMSAPLALPSQAPQEELWLDQQDHRCLAPLADLAPVRMGCHLSKDPTGP